MHRWIQNENVYSGVTASQNRWDAVMKNDPNRSTFAVAARVAYHEMIIWTPPPLITRLTIFFFRPKKRNSIIIKIAGSNRIENFFLNGRAREKWEMRIKLRNNDTLVTVWVDLLTFLLFDFYCYFFFNKLPTSLNGRISWCLLCVPHEKQTEFFPISRALYASFECCSWKTSS